MQQVAADTSHHKYPAKRARTNTRIIFKVTLSDLENNTDSDAN